MRQTRAACCCLTARLQASVCGLSLQPVDCTRALSVTQSAAAAAVFGLWRYISNGSSITFYLTWTGVPHIVGGIARVTGEWTSGQNLGF